MTPGIKKKTNRGRWKPGESGNPSGRPKIDPDLVAACRALTLNAVEVLKAVMTDDHATPSSRVSAAEAILDRAWGKAPQSTVNESRVTIDAAVKVMLDESRARSIVETLQSTRMIGDNGHV